ncbi:hypothetical protein H2201_004076 [Coniosporium apollinis]|uniref:Glutathione S-transferase n=2 Tax=Coniosporium TaxID=2810619 RepID=A0ABQ9NYU5_9PEZI|nr:hypothetical protein H2199_006371 [Cladosporium sp. JES 115]KAJ9665768.1 hypothetical protein H2201_004076 [Coniosporium apollinis]
MIAYSVTVPKEYGYVILAATSTFFLNFWHGTRVGLFRRAAEIPYPHPYATAEQISSASPDKKQAMYLFNCAQRAHGNYLENHPSMVIAMLVSGLQYPRTAAVLGAAWAVFRIIYAVGYTRADKQEGKGRLAGSGFWLAQLAAFGLAGWVGVQMIMGQA